MPILKHEYVVIHYDNMSEDTTAAVNYHYFISKTLALELYNNLLGNWKSGVYDFRPEIYKTLNLDEEC